MRTRPRAVVRAVVGAAVATVMLSACGGGLTPGVASVAAGSTITDHQVTELADAQCAGVQLAAKQGGGQAVSRKQLTERALGLLIDIKLNLAYGKSLGLTPRTAQADADFAQVEPLIQALPAQYHASVTDVFRQWADGRDLMTQLGEKLTGQTATAANADQLLNAGYGKREAWIKTINIDTDPRYAPGKVGWPGEGDSSVSTPVSSFAKGASAQTPSAAFLAGLPAGQRCG